MKISIQVDGDPNSIFKNVTVKPDNEHGVWLTVLKSDDGGFTFFCKTEELLLALQTIDFYQKNKDKHK